MQLHCSQSRFLRALWGEKCVLGWRCYPLIHTIHKERKKEAKKERKAATTTSTFLFDATGILAGWPLAGWRIARRKIRLHNRLR